MSSAQPRGAIAGFVVVTFLWTWSMWWTAALVPGIPAPLLSLLFLTGGLGPLAGAAWLLRGSSPADRGRFLQRIWDPRGIPARVWLAVLGVAGGPALLGAMVALAVGVPVDRPDRGIGAVAGVVAFGLAAGLVEEPGWRGAASDVWQRRAHPTMVALGIGMWWALWHVPLYLVEGSYQQSLGFGSLRFLLTNLALLLLAVLYLWLVNGSGGSILIAVLAHAGFNIAGELVPRSTLGDLVALLVLVLAAAVVLVVTRGRLAAEVASSSRVA